MKVTLTLNGPLAGMVLRIAEEQALSFQGAIQYCLQEVLQAWHPGRSWSEPDPKAGFVYLFAHLTDAGLYKIGFSVHPLRRLEEVARAEDSPLEMLCSIPTTDMRAMESHLHMRFRRSRVRGEWFRLDDEAVADIVRLSGAES